MRKMFLIAVCSLILSGCGWFHVYHPDIYQGNKLRESKVKQLHLGMSKFEVKRLLGDPVLQNTFNNNRLLYVYNFIPNRGKPVAKKLVLTFRGNALVKIEK